MTTRAFVVSGGATIQSIEQARFPKWDSPLVIAADGGLTAAVAIAARFGVNVTAVVGDFDSVDPDLLAALDPAVTAIDRFPTDKDATDLELAMAAAANAGATELCVVDSLQGRVDHFVASQLLLAAPVFDALFVSACIDDARLVVVAPGTTRELDVDVGVTVSLVPVRDATGVTTAGLQYALADAELCVGTTRGISNVTVESRVSVAVRTGALFVIETGVQS